jgi:hypothetical protein
MKTAFCAITLGWAVLMASEAAKGTAAYQSKSGPISVTFKHAYLVKTVDVVTSKPIRRLIFSVADVSGNLQKCDRPMCADGDITEGLTIDLDAGKMLNYWFVANDQKVQFSGVADPETLKLTTDAADRLAGRFDLDSRGGGPAVHLEFDAPLVKEIKGT